jgi:hypothetical protein
MPNISMCMNSKCFHSESCYRFTAKPSEYSQSYGAYTPNSKGDCKYYWKLTEDNVVDLTKREKKKKPADDSEYDFEEVAKKNKEKQERLKKERDKYNKTTKRDYRL